MKKHAYRKDENGLTGIKTNIEICLADTKRRDFQTLRKILQRPISRFDLGYSK